MYPDKADAGERVVAIQVVCRVFFFFFGTLIQPIKSETPGENGEKG